MRRLARIRRLRRHYAHIVDVRARDLAAARQRCAARRAAIEALEAERDAATEAVGRRWSVDAALRLDAWRRHVAARIAEHRAALEVALDAERHARDAVVSARRDRELWERLEARRQAELADESRRLDALEIDDLAQRRRAVGGTILPGRRRAG